MHASICRLLLLTSVISAQRNVFKNYVLKYALGVYSKRLSLRINIYLSLPVRNKANA